MKNQELHSQLIELLAEWLESPIGQTSADRQVVIAAVEKLSGTTPVFSQEETDVVIDCMMETVDIGSDFADAAIDYLNVRTL